MVYACIGVRFKNSIPTVNFDEAPTYHVIDPKVVGPKRPFKPTDVVIIKTIGMPQVKMILERYGSSDKPLGGNIVGKVVFYDPIPEADRDTEQGGLSPA